VCGCPFVRPCLAHACTYGPHGRRGRGQWTITRRTDRRHENTEGRDARRVAPKGGDTTTNAAGSESGSEGTDAYKRKDQDALRAYHLERVFRKFNKVISAENAELLAGLLDSDSGEDRDVA
jgi:hypothetical protein